MKYTRSGCALQNNNLKEWEKLREKYGKEIFWYDHELDFEIGDTVKVTMDTQDRPTQKITGIYMGCSSLPNLIVIKTSESKFCVNIHAILTIEIIKHSPKNPEASAELEKIYNKIREQPSTMMSV